MATISRADGEAMEAQDQARADLRMPREPDQDVVAEAAARLLAEADRARELQRDDDAPRAGDAPADAGRDT